MPRYIDLSTFNGSGKKNMAKVSTCVMEVGKKHGQDEPNLICKLRTYSMYKEFINLE